MPHATWASCPKPTMQVEHHFPLEKRAQSWGGGLLDWGLGGGSHLQFCPHPKSKLRIKKKLFVPPGPGRVGNKTGK
jgi:hypothetical protein